MKNNCYKTKRNISQRCTKTLAYIDVNKTISSIHSESNRS